MKKLFRLAYLGLFIISIASCDKSQVTSDLSDQELGGPVFYSVSTVNGILDIEKIPISDLKTHLKSKSKARKVTNHSVNGLTKSSGGDQATFSAMQNNGGVHGNTHFSGSFLIDLKFDSECISVFDNNKAYWGGTVTVFEVAEPLPFPFGVGDQIYWSAIDNGEGSNSLPDEIGDAFILIPGGLVATDFGFDSWCDFTDLDYNGYIHPGGHGYYPGEKPTNVQVK